MDTEVFKKVPKAYYVVAAMAAIVIGILFFGGGKKALSTLDQTTIEFKLKSYEEVLNEENQVDVVLISSKSFKAKIAIDPINISNYDGLISSLKQENAEIKVSIQNSDKSLLQDDEIIATDSIWVNGIEYFDNSKE